MPTVTPNELGQNQCAILLCAIGAREQVEDFGAARDFGLFSHCRPLGVPLVRADGVKYEGMGIDDLELMRWLVSCVACEQGRLEGDLVSLSDEEYDVWCAGLEERARQEAYWASLPPPGPWEPTPYSEEILRGVLAVAAI
jgi:hypothetical protein